MRTAATDMHDHCLEFVRSIAAVSARTTSVSPAHVAQLWYGVLQGLRPSATGRSLHVTHADYEVGSKKYTAFWTGTDALPCMIEIYDPSIELDWE